MNKFAKVGILKIQQADSSKYKSNNFTGVAE